MMSGDATVRSLPHPAASSSSSRGRGCKRADGNDRTFFLCFDASREGFLWLSRYLCFPFLLVTLGISLVTTWRYVFLPWRIFDDVALLLFAAGTHAFAFLVVYLLFKTNLTSPGHVPLDWEPPTELVESGYFVEPTDREFSTPTWCSKCQSHRPKRAHHCRHCQRHVQAPSAGERERTVVPADMSSRVYRCVLVFDHHCPWVNNCVGWMNIKYFMLLLFYAAAYSGIICFSWLVRCYQVIWIYPEAVSIFTKLVLVGLLMTWITFGFGICSLAQAMMVHVVYLTPTFEKQHIRNRIKKTLGMPRAERLGWLRNNVCLVFGKNAALWYVPTLPDTDPFHYPSFTDTFFLDEEEPTQEPGLDTERRESFHLLQEYREEDRNADTHDWNKAEAATSGDHDAAPMFDPSQFYGQMPRKGG